MMTLKEQRRAERLDKFFNKFGKISSPECFKCKKPVDKFGVDYDPDKDLIIAMAECHDDKEKAIFSFDKIMRFDTCVIQQAFIRKTELLNGEKVIVQ